MFTICGLAARGIVGGVCRRQTDSLRKNKLFSADFRFRCQPSVDPPHYTAGRLSAFRRLKVSRPRPRALTKKAVKNSRFLQLIIIMIIM